MPGFLGSSLPFDAREIPSRHRTARVTRTRSSCPATANPNVASGATLRRSHDLSVGGRRLRSLPRADEAHSSRPVAHVEARPTGPARCHFHLSASIDRDLETSSCTVGNGETTRQTNRRTIRSRCRCTDRRPSSRNARHRCDQQPNAFEAISGDSSVAVRSLIVPSLTSQESKPSE